MGKSKKKDDEKRAALQARKEAKADKVAQKRMKKEQGSLDDGDEDNLDNLLDVYRKRDIEVNTTLLETLPSFPPPRGNASMTQVEDKNGYIYVFGGEYYDGIENIVIDDLLRWDPTKREWKQILTPNPRPAPRCAHSCIAYKKSLYVFGGELASAEQYHHYRDLWRFDTITLKWEEIITRNTGTIPTARSGHTVFLWKNFMILFGGFHEALKDTRWFNDVCILDLQTLVWLDIPHSKLTARPEPRSACNVGILNDVAIIHGGYSKLKNSSLSETSTFTTKGGGEAKVHNDTWLLHLKPILQGKPPTWERLSSARAINRGPQNRAGTSSASYKGRMLVFGGVVDEEQAHHKVASVFYNDLFAFDMERRKWFPVRCKAIPEDGAVKKSRRRRKVDSGDEHAAQVEDVDEITVTSENEGDDLELDEDEIDENPVTGWDLHKLRSNMFAFIDGDGNIVYEKIDEDPDKEQNHNNDDDNDDDGDHKEMEEEKENDSERSERDDGEWRSNPDQNENSQYNSVSLTPDSLTSSKTVRDSQVMFLNKETGIPEAVARSEPLPRMNANMLVRSNSLFVYGGILEIGDREVTLDDCWTMDLRKRTGWECIWQGTMHKQIWRGAIHDDDDSYISTGAGGGDDDSSEEGDDADNDDVNHHCGESLKAMEQQLGGSSTKTKLRGSAQSELASLTENLNFGDDNQFPALGESMADFFARTCEFWTEKAAESLQARTDGVEPLSQKESKREGFRLAQNRFDEVMKSESDVATKSKGERKKEKSKKKVPK